MKRYIVLGVLSILAFSSNLRASKLQWSWMMTSSSISSLNTNGMPYLILNLKEFDMGIGMRNRQISQNNDDTLTTFSVISKNRYPVKDSENLHLTVTLEIENTTGEYVGEKISNYSAMGVAVGFECDISQRLKFSADYFPFVTEKIEFRDLNEDMEISSLSKVRIGAIYKM